MADYKKYLDPSVTSKLSRLDLVAKLVVEGFITGLHKSPYHGFSVEFSSYRQYMMGDPLRHIDWKVYGKSDRLYIKQFEEETNLKAYLLVDTSASMGFSSGGITKLQYATQLAAAFSYLALKQRDAVGLTTFSDTIEVHLPPRSIKSHLNRLLAALEGISPHAGTNTAQALHITAEKIKRRGLVVVFSDLLDDPVKILNGLNHFRYSNNEVIVFHILDPREYDFAFDVEAEFCDMETGDVLTTQPWHIQKEYSAAVKDWIRKLRRSLTDKKIEYVPLDTSMDYGHALLEYLKKRKKIR